MACRAGRCHKQQQLPNLRLHPLWQRLCAQHMPQTCGPQQAASRRSSYCGESGHRADNAVCPQYRLFFANKQPRKVAAAVTLAVAAADVTVGWWIS